jgi:hypothetical protein
MEGIRRITGWLTFRRVGETTFHPKEDADQDENAAMPHAIIYQHFQCRCKPGRSDSALGSHPAITAMG